MIEEIVDLHGVTNFLSDDIKRRQTVRREVNLFYRLAGSEEHVRYLDYKMPLFREGSPIKLQRVFEVQDQVPFQKQLQVAMAIIAYSGAKDKPQVIFR